MRAEAKDLEQGRGQTSPTRLRSPEPRPPKDLEKWSPKWGKNPPQGKASRSISKSNEQPSEPSTSPHQLQDSGNLVSPEGRGLASLVDHRKSSKS